MTIERDDPLGAAFGSALGVRAGDFVFTTVAGVEGLEEGEPVFAATSIVSLRSSASTFFNVCIISAAN